MRDPLTLHSILSLGQTRGQNFDRALMMIVYYGPGSKRGAVQVGHVPGCLYPRTTPLKSLNQRTYRGIRDDTRIALNSNKYHYPHVEVSFRCKYSDEYELQFLECDSSNSRNVFPLWV